MIVGATGSGKSYGYKTLDPKASLIISVNESKRPPFKDGSKLWNKENGNFWNMDKANQIIAALKNIPTKFPNVRTIVIDDARHIMEREYLNKALEAG